MMPLWIKEAARASEALAATMQQIPEANYSRRKPRKHGNWLSDFRHYRRATINRESWIGSDGLE